MKREDADLLYNKMKESMPHHIILRDLFEFIIEHTPHHQNHSKEQRLENVVNAFWGKPKRKRGRQERKSDLFFLGRIFREQKKEPEKDIQGIAWDVVIHAHEKHHDAIALNNFKNRLIAKYKKSKERNFAEGFQNDFERTEALYKKFLRFYYNDFRIIRTWFEKWADLEIKDLKRCPVEEYFFK